jgi:threonine dehydratase
VSSPNQSFSIAWTHRDLIRPTTLIDATRLKRRLGVDIIIASETFQHTGSFKFRAALNVAAQVPQRHLITASSGNFGQALAYACQLLGKSCTVVMPATSAQVKVEAVREYGGTVELIDVNRISRGQRVVELAREHPDAYVASAYDDALVIEGNASLGTELCRLDRHFDVVLAPVGGGGLTAGLVQGIAQAGKPIKVMGAEPLLANDAARSLRAGERIQNESEPQTIADGTRTLSLGERNWTILKTGLAGIVEVPEEAIQEAVRLLFLLANLKVEPTGALSLAALLTAPHFFQNQSVCCVASGGNVDPETYRRLLAE